MSWHVRFQNGYTRRVQIAISFKDDSCSQYGEPWGTRGWYLLNPEESQYVIRTNNRFFYYYAEAVDGSRLWTSENFFTPVTQKAFDSCVGIGSSGARDVGMIELDLNINNYWRLT